jgi:coenzyme PQQ synthesis protein D (PqqD)
MSTSKVSIRVPQVLHQAVDGEVLIVNTETGVYYALRSVAADIWQAIQRSGTSVDDIVASVAARYGAAVEVVDGIVSRFIAELSGESLVVLDCGTDAHRAVAGVSAMAASRLPFSLPRLEKFTDLRHYLIR